MEKRSKLLLFICALPFATALFIDQYTKIWATHLLSDHTWGIFHINLVYNPGMMLGYLSELPHELKAVTFTTIGSLILATYVMCLWLVPIRSRSTLFGLSLLVSGIMGNVIDRFSHPGVIDFIAIRLEEFQGPYANFADFIQWPGYLLIALGIYRDSLYYWPSVDLRSRFLINPKLQIRVASLITLFSFFSGVISLVFAYTFFKAINFGIDLDGLFFKLAFAMLAIISTLVFVSSLVLSHRIAGPVYSILRHLREALKGKDATFSLREKDEFKNFIEEVNELSRDIRRFKEDKKEDDRKAS